jgi:[ribosomal protein S5]-alanine N-acetyltransferase
MLTLTLAPFSPLSTPRLLLRQPALTDVPALFGIRSDARVMRYIGRPPMSDPAEAEQLVAAFTTSFERNEGIVWAICKHEAPDRLIGTIGFWKMDKANHRTEIGYLLGADWWRQGIMDEAMTAVLEYGFKTLGFHSVEANTDPENEASGGILEKHGFVQEAYFRENFYFEGRFLDSRIYSKINPYHRRSSTS